MRSDMSWQPRQPNSVTIACVLTYAMMSAIIVAQTIIPANIFMSSSHVKPKTTAKPTPDPDYQSPCE